MPGTKLTQKQRFVLAWMARGSHKKYSQWVHPCGAATRVCRTLVKLGYAKEDEGREGFTITDEGRERAKKEKFKPTTPTEALALWLRHSPRMRAIKDFVEANLPGYKVEVSESSMTNYQKIGRLRWDGATYKGNEIEIRNPKGKVVHTNDTAQPYPYGLVETTVWWVIEEMGLSKSKLKEGVV